MYVIYFCLILCVYFCCTFGEMDNRDYIDQPSEREILIQIEKTNRKLDLIQLMMPDLEESINRKLFKLEEYIDSKLNNLQINIPEKIKQYSNCNLDIANNQSFEKLEENVNSKIYVPRNSNQLEEKNNCKCVTDFEKTMNRKLEDISKNMSMKFEENINLKLKALASNISKEFEENFTKSDKNKSEFLMKTTDIENKINWKLEVLNKKIPTNLEENINLELHALTRNISKELKLNNNFLLNALKNTTVREIHDNTNLGCEMLPLLPHGSAKLLNGTTHLGSVVQYSCATNYRLVGPTRRTCTENSQWSDSTPICEGLPCKEERVAQHGSTPKYSLDDVSLHHYGTLRRDSTGRRTYIELQFAVQTDGYVGIVLSEKEEYSLGIYCDLYVGAYMNPRTGLWYNYALVQDVPTPDILSSTQFRSFYIKIEDGKLQFGKEGDAPLILYSGVDFVGSLNYYRFYSNEGSANFRYCPAADQGSS